MCLVSYYTLRSASIPPIIELSFPWFLVSLCLQAVVFVFLLFFFLFIQLVFFQVLATSLAEGGHDRLFCLVFAYIFISL